MSIPSPQSPPHRQSSSFVALIGSAILILALCVGSAAAAQAPVGLSRHQNWMYKVEQHVTLEDQSSDTFTVACKPGDIVIDGMTRIDHVDQDTGTLADVQVLAAYPSASDRYFFNINNNAEGNAQLKLFITCLDNTTSTVKGHNHTYSSTLPPGASATLAGAPGSYNSSSSCDPDQIVVAPGFQITQGYTRLLRSKPSNATVNTWNWRIYTNDVPAAVSYLHRCLNVKTSSAAGHRHKLTYSLASTLSPVIPPNSVVERKISCDEHEKAMIHSFDLDPFEDSFFLFFHGMDPRPKERAYRVENTDVFGHTAHFSAVCFADRTGKKI